MKQVSPLWNGTNVAATNSSNFNGLPGGTRDHTGWFYNARVLGSWWSSNQNSSFYLTIDSSMMFFQNNLNVKYGCYVRCFKD